MSRILISTFMLVSVCLSNLYAQCALIEVSLDDRKTEASLIVEAKVISSYSSWDTQQEMIYSSHKLDVFKVFKGHVNGDLEVLTPGGVVALDKIEVDPALKLNVGETGIFFLKGTSLTLLNPSSTTTLAPVAGPQAFLKYDAYDNKATDVFNEYTDVNILYNSISRRYTELKTYNLAQQSANLHSRQAPAISSISPTSISAGTYSVLTISGSGFGGSQGAGYVEFRRADDGGASWIQPLASSYVSWSANQIRVEVHSDAGTGQVRVNKSGVATSAATLDITYAYSTIDFDAGSGDAEYQPDLIDDNGNDGYTLQLHTDFNNNAAAKAAFERALGNWVCATQVNFVLGAVTTVDVASAGDATNVIRFDNGSELPSGVLGRTAISFGGCGFSGVEWYINGFDISFDDGTNWEFGPGNPSFTEYDFESVALHELGHAHLLGHVIGSNRVMHYSLPNFTVLRILNSADIAGGNAVMVNSTSNNSCGPGKMLVNNNCAQCPEPTNLITTRITPSSARFGWDVVGSADHYVIRGKNVNGANWTEITIPNGSPNFKNIQGLNDGATYEWQIKAVCNASGTIESAYSPLVQFTAACQAPTGLYADPITSNGARLNWNSVSGAFGYEIRGRIAGSSGSFASITVGPSTARDVFGLQPSKSYEWKIRTSCNQNLTSLSPFSALDVFTTGSGSKLSGLNDPFAGNIEFMEIFPNPIENQAMIRLSEVNADDNISLRLIDITGKIQEANLWSLDNDLFQLQSDHLSSGVYIIELRINEGLAERKRVVIQ